MVRGIVSETHELRQKACIVGIGETPYVRNSGKTAREMVFDAVERACRDAGICVRDLDGVVEMGGSGHVVTAQQLQLNYGIKDLPYVAAAPFGAGSAAAASVGMATAALDAGMCKYVACWHFTDWSSQSTTPGDAHDHEPNKHDFETPFGWFGQPAHLAMCARRHMATYGTKYEHLGAIAVTQRAHAALNGNAVMTAPLTMEDYLSARWIAEPFRLFDCCVINDGAAAYVMTTPDRARDMPRPPVSFLGVGLSSGDRTVYWAQQPDITHTSAVHSAPRAYAMAGVGPEDVDFLQLYDCFTWVVLSSIEDHGFCKKGEGGDFLDAGRRISVGGELPVNTHGGMLSQSYLQGMNHICEAVRQLRGEAGAAQVAGAEVGLVGGYAGATYGTLILGSGD
jgi:acetyl-CoA acetyltransferase